MLETWKWQIFKASSCDVNVESARASTWTHVRENVVPVLRRPFVVRCLPD